MEDRRVERIGRAVFVGEHVSGTSPFDTPVSPNRWCGDAGCIVGPFSSEIVAARFAGRHADFGAYGGYRFRVFAQRDSWYVEVAGTETEIEATSLVSAGREA